MNTSMICAFAGPSSTSRFFLEYVIFQNYHWWKMTQGQTRFCQDKRHSNSSTGNITKTRLNVLETRMYATFGNLAFVYSTRNLRIDLLKVKDQGFFRISERHTGIGTITKLHNQIGSPVTWCPWLASGTRWRMLIVSQADDERIGKNG
jgi:hypothetical protein